MTGQERMLLSGGTVNHAFLKGMMGLNHSDTPNVLIDQSGAGNPKSFEVGVEIAMILHRDFDIQAQHLQPAFGKNPSPVEANEQLAAANTLLVLGDSTSRVLRNWEKLGLEESLVNRVRRGSLVVGGADAGALAWFGKAHTDSAKYEVRDGETWLYATTPATSVLPGWATTRYGQIDELGRSRAESFRNSLYYGEGLWHKGIALEENAAIICENGIAEAVQLADGDANVYAFYGLTRDLAYRQRVGERIGILSIPGI